MNVDEKKIRHLVTDFSEFQQGRFNIFEMIVKEMNKNLDLSKDYEIHFILTEKENNK